MRFLASDELEGRGPGSDGLQKAAEMIAERFAAIGLETELFDGQPFQPVPVDTRYAPEAGGENALAFELTGDGETTHVAAEIGRQFNPLALGTNGEAEGNVVFAGYGITAQEHGYDDYAGLDVEGKIVLVLRKEPHQGEAESPFGRQRPTPYAYFSTKMTNAAAHGAAALIVVNDAETLRAAAADGEAADAEAARDAADLATLLDIEEAGRAGSKSTVPAFSLARHVADRLVRHGMGRSLDQLEAAIDEELRPHSAELGGVRGVGRARLRKDEVLGQNVLGVLPGSGPLASETVVLGAHYDHVGMGGPGSLAPGTIAVHNGADDNASGTAVLLEVASRLAAEPPEGPRRRVLFIAFTGEERGLLGSRRYVRQPRFPLEETVAMVNLDMVGRLKGNDLTVYGTGTSSAFDPLLDRLNEQSEFQLRREATGYGPSDHQSFYEQDIPVLHFFTGLHNDYHRPSDDSDKINWNGLARITDMVSGAVSRLAVMPERPDYRDTDRSFSVRHQRAGYLGVRLVENADGAVVRTVEPQSAAAAAGLRRGDRITAVEDTDVADTASLQRAISDRSPGETVNLRLVRDGETVERRVQLSERPNGD